MKPIIITTSIKKILADVYTPVGIYLRVRDRFRDTILLESADYHVAENSYSFICINAIAGIEISSAHSMEYKLPAQEPEKITLDKNVSVPALLGEFIQRFETQETPHKEASFAQRLYGYATFDAVQFFDKIPIPEYTGADHIPLMRYRLYQYVIAINHYKDELFICENNIAGIESELNVVESLIRGKNVPVYPFRLNGNEQANMSDDDYKAMVQKGIQSCYRGDVFQIVLSRRYSQPFIGDEFNVYRALRNINPSPYLFFFDYGDYRLLGSSPESQLIVTNGKVIVHPIAGTYKRTGDDETDKRETERLRTDPKENAEHVMLVDLARNDLSRISDNVQVSYYKQIKYYSHVIHLVSEVTGDIRPGVNPFEMMAKTFPAGTLSGAPKIKAVELINRYESGHRGYYGGAIGFVGFDGSFNHAIMIRTFLSKANTLIYQGGAGIVAASDPGLELQEVHNKLGALKKAVEMAEKLDN